MRTCVMEVSEGEEGSWEGEVGVGLIVALGEVVIILIIHCPLAGWEFWRASPQPDFST